MSPQEQRILRAIAKDVSEIKSQIVNLRVRVAAISATVALVVTLVTGLLFHELTKQPAPAHPVSIPESRTVERSRPAHVLAGRK